MKIGIDIGGVIIDHVKAKLQNFDYNEDDYSLIPEVENAIETIKKLVVFFSLSKVEVVLVSKCTKWAEGRIREWLCSHDFYRKTGLKEEALHFCQEFHQKMEISKDLKITHFIDDRPDVLYHLIGVVPNLYYFKWGDSPSLAETVVFKNLSIFIECADWFEIERLLVSKNLEVAA